MSLCALVIVVWSTVLSALGNASSTSMASSVTDWIEVSSVVSISGVSSGTSSETEVSANNLGTVVVIPEVV